MPTPRVILIETAATLPGLLPPSAYDALQRAVLILARNPEDHPGVPALRAGGFDVERAEASAPRTSRGIDLMSAGGDATEVRLADGVLDTATAVDGEVAYLLGPNDAGFARTVGIQAARTRAVEIELVFLVGAPRGLEVLAAVEVMARLRRPDDGCPWDLEQTHASLAPHLLEEACEALEAIDTGDDAHVAEELGDVLLQVLFHAQLGFERSSFGIDEVARGLVDKLVHRHPHVFADAVAEDADEVQATWDELKDQEKPHRTGVFDGVPATLPALMLSDKLQRRAARHGVDADDVDAAKVHDLVARVVAATTNDVDQRLGELLWSVVRLARSLGVEPESALRRAGAAFRTRVEENPTPRSDGWSGPEDPATSPATRP